MVNVYFNGQTKEINETEFELDVKKSTFNPFLYYGLVERQITGDIYITLLKEGEYIQLKEGLELISIIAGTDLREDPNAR